MCPFPQVVVCSCGHHHTVQPQFKVQLQNANRRNQSSGAVPVETIRVTLRLFTIKERLFREDRFIIERGRENSFVGLCKVCNGENLRKNAKVLIDKDHRTRFPS